MMHKQERLARHVLLLISGEGARWSFLVTRCTNLVEQLRRTRRKCT